MREDGHPPGGAVGRHGVLVVGGDRHRAALGGRGTRGPRWVAAAAAAGVAGAAARTAAGHAPAGRAPGTNPGVGRQGAAAGAFQVAGFARERQGAHQASKTDPLRLRLMFSGVHVQCLLRGHCSAAPVPARKPKEIKGLQPPGPPAAESAVATRKISGEAHAKAAVTGRDGTGRDGRDGTGRDGTGRDGTGREGTGPCLALLLSCPLAPVAGERARERGLPTSLRGAGKAGLGWERFDQEICTITGKSRSRCVARWTTCKKTYSLHLQLLVSFSAFASDSQSAVA